MASTGLSRESLQKHNEKLEKGSKSSVDDGKRSEGKKSETGSASGHPGSGTGKAGFTATRQRRISRWSKPPAMPAVGKMSAVSLSSRERHSLQRVENTYKMVPDHGTKFSAAKVKGVTEEAIEHFLGDSKKYDSKKFTDVSKLLADDIKNRVKELGYSRYKIVVHVMLGQVAAQSMEVASRCVWDTQNDNMLTVTRKNGDMYVIASVFGTYYE